MLTRYAGYYLDPPAWVQEHPLRADGTVDRAQMDEIVYNEPLPQGLRGIALRSGWFGFDFGNSQRGKVRPIKPIASGPYKGKYLNTADAFVALLEAKTDRATVCNVHLACLYTALNKQGPYSTKNMAVSPEDVAPFLDDATIANRRLAALQTAGRIAPIVALATVEESFGLLGTILGKQSPDILAIVDLYARSLNAFSKHEHSFCLILAWAVTEKLLGTMWQRYIAADRQQAKLAATTYYAARNKKVPKTGLDDYNAATISGIMESVSVLPPVIYQDLDIARKQRNAWMHELRPATFDDARLAIRTAEQMIHEVEGITFSAYLALEISA